MSGQESAPAISPHVQRVRTQILEMLRKQPMTTIQIARALNKNDKTLRTDYLKPIANEGLIQKQGNAYSVPNAAATVIDKSYFDDIVAKDSFSQLPIMADFVEHMRKIIAGGWFVAEFRKICGGKSVPGFKCRPEHWTVETTPIFMRAHLDFKKKERASFHIRQLMRYVHEDVLKKPLTDAQKGSWGVDGKKNKPAYSHVRLTEGQIHDLIKYYADKGDLQVAGYVAGGIEMFGRPKAMHDAETKRFQLAERTITRATIQGLPEPIYDSKFMIVLQALALKDPDLIKIESYKAPAIEGELYENKTKEFWHKRILGSYAVKIMTELLHERRDKPNLFNWQGMLHDKWETWLSATLRKGFREVNATHEFFTKKPMYALRHVGAQMWLNRTGYDYAGVAQMGWTDVATLHRYYGGYSMEFFNQKVAVAYA